MKHIFKRKKAPPEEPMVLSFLDCITPGVLKFETDHYISGNTWRCVWALREYPAATDSQALLGRLGDRRGVTLRIVCRLVTPAEENRIIHNATNRNKLERANTNNLRRVITAESNLQDMASLVGALDREHEPLLYCAVYVEVMADSFENLKLLQTSVEAELVRCKLTIDKLVLRQQQGFLTANPAGYAALGPQFQRVLPASSVANLFPFNYSGKADPNGFYIGKDKFGSNIVVDFDRRESDKTSANILILGNSGQGIWMTGRRRTMWPAAVRLSLRWSRCSAPTRRSGRCISVSIMTRPDTVPRSGWKVISVRKAFPLCGWCRCKRIGTRICARNRTSRQYETVGSYVISLLVTQQQRTKYGKKILTDLPCDLDSGGFVVNMGREVPRRNDRVPSIRIIDHTGSVGFLQHGAW